MKLIDLGSPTEARPTTGHGGTLVRVVPSGKSGRSATAGTIARQTVRRSAQIGAAGFPPRTRQSSGPESWGHQDGTACRLAPGTRATHAGPWFAWAVSDGAQNIGVGFGDVPASSCSDSTSHTLLARTGAGAARIFMSRG